MSKALDTMDQKILLKLEHIGVRGINQRSFSEYLNNRSKHVYFKGHLSTKTTTTLYSGFIAFEMYVTDLSTTLKILNFILFADDTNVFISEKSLVTLFERANYELTVKSA